MPSPGMPSPAMSSLAIPSPAMPSPAIPSQPGMGWAKHGGAKHIIAGGAAQACLACQHHKEQVRLSLCREKLYSWSNFQGNPEFGPTLIALRGLMIEAISEKLMISMSRMDLARVGELGSKQRASQFDHVPLCSMISKLN